jgi:hypothetical protein
MSELIQELESRVLFSSMVGAVGAGTQLAADVGTARADLTQYATTLRQDVRTVAADLRALPSSTTNTKLQATLRTDRAKWANTIQQDVLSAVRAATADGTKTVSAAVRVFLHPTNATFAKALATDLKAVGHALAGPLARLQTDVASARSALLNDLNGVATANPAATALQTDVNQLGADTQNAIDKLTTDGQAIQSDLQTLVADLGA